MTSNFELYFRVLATLINCDLLIWMRFFFFGDRSIDFRVSWMLRYFRNKPFKTAHESVAFINRCHIVMKISQRGQCSRKVEARTLLSILNTRHKWIADIFYILTLRLQRWFLLWIQNSLLSTYSRQNFECLASSLSWIYPQPILNNHYPSAAYYIPWKNIHNSISSIRKQQLFIWSRCHILSVQKFATRQSPSVEISATLEEYGPVK